MARRKKQNHWTRFSFARISPCNEENVYIDLMKIKKRKRVGWAETKTFYDPTAVSKTNGGQRSHNSLLKGSFGLSCYPA